jgi:hypothetical protein
VQTTFWAQAIVEVFDDEAISTDVFQGLTTNDLIELPTKLG